MNKFQKFFGQEEIKYSIHLMLHIGLAIKMFGPLHLVACYRPENEIGKIARRVCGTYHHTESIMDTFLKISHCGAELDEMAHNSTGAVKDVVSFLLGMPIVPFIRKSTDGVCRLIGKPERVLDGDTLVSLQDLARKASETWLKEDILEFRRALVESGIYVRTWFHNVDCSRNEYLVLDREKRIFKIISIIAILRGTEVAHTFIRAIRYEILDEDHEEKYPSGIECPHIFKIAPVSQDLHLVETKLVKSQLIILDEPLGTLEKLVSAPSNIFLTT